MQCLRLHNLLQARPPLSPAQRLCLSSALDAVWLSLSTALSTATPAVLPLLRLDGLLLRRRQSSPPPPLPLSPTHCLCDSSAVDMLVGIVLVVRRLQHDCVSAASTAADTLWHRLRVSRSQLSCSSASCSRSDAGGTTNAAAAAAPHWCLQHAKRLQALAVIACSVCVCTTCCKPGHRCHLLNVCVSRARSTLSGCRCPQLCPLRRQQCCHCSAWMVSSAVSRQSSPPPPLPLSRAHHLRDSSAHLT